jgi:predicted RNA polymerase sigma factor
MPSEIDLNRAMKVAKEELDAASMEVAECADRYFARKEKSDKAQAELMKTLLSILGKWRQLKQAYERALDAWESASDRTVLEVERPSSFTGEHTMPGAPLDTTDPSLKRKG